MGCVLVAKGGKKQKGERGRREKVALYQVHFLLLLHKSLGERGRRGRTCNWECGGRW